MPVSPVARLIAQGARQRGLDPQAVLAVARQEGLSGNVGDQGTSFGPFQLHQGGAFPSGRVPAGREQQWAMSPVGINFALDRIAGVAKGLRGPAAVQNIVRRFERPANPEAEVRRALAGYGGQGALQAGAPAAQSPAGGAPAGLLQALTAARSAVGLDAPGPGLLAALQARFAAPRPGAAAAPAAAPVARALQSRRSVKAGVPVAELTGEGGAHPTMGLEGFPAHDFMAPSGSPAVAPVAGEVIRLSGHDAANGPQQGPHGPLGLSVYIRGDDGRTYYLTHLGTRSVKVGQRLELGVPIGTVADYAKYGTPSHIHMGVSG